MSYADDSYRKIKLLESERDRLKAELENEKIEVMSYARNLNKCVAERNGAREDRDAWKSKADKLAEALRGAIIANPYGLNTDAKAALAEFGEAI